MTNARALSCSCGEACALDPELVVACAEIAVFMAVHAYHGKISMTMRLDESHVTQRVNRI